MEHRCASMPVVQYKYQRMDAIGSAPVRWIFNTGISQCGPVQFCQFCGVKLESDDAPFTTEQERRIEGMISSRLIKHHDSSHAPLGSPFTSDQIAFIAGMIDQHADANRSLGHEAKPTETPEPEPEQPKRQIIINSGPGFCNACGHPDAWHDGDGCRFMMAGTLWADGSPICICSSLAPSSQVTMRDEDKWQRDALIAARRARGFLPANARNTGGKKTSESSTE